MKILMANALYPTPRYPLVIGGAEKSVRLLAEALVDHGHEVTVVVPLSPELPRSGETLNGVRIERLPTRNLYHFKTRSEQPAWRKLAWHLLDDNGAAPLGFDEILDSFRPDILHTHVLSNISTAVWRLAAERKIPIVHTLRDYQLLCAKSTMFKAMQNCQKSCVACALLTHRRRHDTTLVNTVIGISTHILSIHKKLGLFSLSKDLVIGNIAEKPTEASLIRPALAHSDGIRVGYIGRASEEKGVIILAKAVALASGNITELVIAGDVDEEMRATLARTAGDVAINFLGFVSPAQFYPLVDVVVVPSLWAEPLGRSVLDAVAYGVPVMGSNIGGIPEAIGQPPFGWLFPPGDTSYLAGLLQQVSRETIAQFGQPTPPAPSEGSLIDKQILAYLRAQPDL